MQEILSHPWPWWFSGLMIAVILFALLYFGQTFGFSANLSTICAAAGLGKKVPFFDFNWKARIWNLVFLVGAIIGGFLSKQLLFSDNPVQISSETIHDLAGLGFAAPTSLQPPELYSLDAMLSVKGFSILAISGLMIGFGTRYAGGCTSGHAITGLSDLQLPSLIAVAGFFIGGLIMTYFIYPILF